MAEVVEPTLEPASVPASDARPRRWDWRPWRPRLRWFAAEFLVVVSGILVALALNAWWQGRQDAVSEENYLALISRDLGQMRDNLEELRAFEEMQVRDGLRAYRILSNPPLSPEQKTEVSLIVTRLESRRTMAVVDAAYEDLTSTGNLRLIQDQGLRDRIVTFYEEVERELTIHSRNNSFFVDDLFVSRLFGQGFFFYRVAPNHILYAGSDSMLSAELAGGYIEESDPIWSLPDDAAEWALVKGQLILRLDVSAAALGRAGRLLEGVRALREAVDNELNR